MSLYKSIKSKKEKIAVVGLGYVGLPLALEFGKVVPTLGFDVNEKRITTLKNGEDYNQETETQEFRNSALIEFSSDPSLIKNCKFIIVAVPTPITKTKQPDLTAMTKASQTVGRNLSKGSIVVYESTVFPGVTEDICVPILEQESGLKQGTDFFIGYSPERINPGDKVHTVTNILKIVSGENDEILEEIASIYEIVIKAGVFKAKSIKSAEAAKVIENTQRDLNIALINELSMVFDKMNIDTQSVLEAAGTKWNFIKMSPGLVGGHCIGVDPYYLTYKAQELGYHPQVILAGRRINDGMGKYIAEQTVKKLIHADKTVKNSRVLVMGITFKENVSDIRNSKVIDVIRELEDYGLDVKVTDPLANPLEVKEEYGLELIECNPDQKFDALVITVNHDLFKQYLTTAQIEKHVKNGHGKGVVIDVKWLLEKEQVEDLDLIYWRL